MSKDEEGFHSPTGSDNEDEETNAPPAKAYEYHGNLNSAGEVQSYADVRGEWEQRKISLFGAVRSFIGQLKVGQDMTRVSLPCVFLRPYSLLEEVASRNFSHFPILFDAPKTTDPLLRMLLVIKWLITTAKQEHYNHKPFNPVAGEVNRCYFTHAKDDTTFFLVEQVKHHPPTCGIRIDNPAHKIAVQGNYTFQVQFNKNSVSIANNGKVNIKIGDENYFMAKAMPDINVKNVILGTKLVAWEGKLSLDCKESGYYAECELYVKDRTNLVKGKIIHKATSEEPVAFIEGKCGGLTHWFYNVKHPNHKDKSKDEKKKLEKGTILVEDNPEDKEKPITPKYPKSQEPNSSINTWSKVAKCIIENDMEKGDAEKVVIEEKQRGTLGGLKDKGEEFVPVWFEQDDTLGWRIKDEKWYKRFEY
eukprot:TRINITY_DN26522_c0_g1_i1.p1 TRINITY_DN26522_c0_g1~~TRINITY_DN26522_c0_g1_i1.p1  ORF type:complete len:418 (+),score=93.80 TRINITY_DN26522_c0_g1_i1:100-1353(+)